MSESLDYTCNRPLYELFCNLINASAREFIAKKGGILVPGMKIMGWIVDKIKYIFINKGFHVNHRTLYLFISFFLLQTPQTGVVHVLIVTVYIFL